MNAHVSLMLMLLGFLTTVGCSSGSRTEPSGESVIPSASVGKEPLDEAGTVEPPDFASVGQTLPSVLLEDVSTKFRGMPWGAHIDEVPDMELVDGHLASLAVYGRKGDSAEVGRSRYYFYEGRFFWGETITTGSADFQTLKDALVERYGEGDKPNESHDQWMWDKGDVSLALEYNRTLEESTLRMVYVPIAALFADEQNRRASVSADFRGIAWGTHIDELSDMVLRSDDGHGRKTYNREGENLSIGNVKLKAIEYSFFNSRFYFVNIEAHGILNWRPLQNAVFARYGEGKKDGDYWRWQFGDVSIVLNYNRSTEKIWLAMAYLPISKEATAARVKRAAEAAEAAAETDF